jgi:hypothetical protein
MPLSRTDTSAVTLPFEKFWSWLQAHSNCVLRAGTPEVVLFDHDDYHWHLGAEDESVLLVQLIRGKDLVGEIVVLSSEISYVQCEAGDTEEFVFECVVDSEAAREVAYHFVMAHGYEGDGEREGGRWRH